MDTHEQLQTMHDHWVAKLKRKGIIYDFNTALDCAPDGIMPPHAITRQGFHSNGFVQLKLLSEDRCALAEAAHFLATRFGLLNGLMPAYVVGVGSTSETIAYLVADQLQARPTYTEKAADKERCTIDVPPHTPVLVVEGTIVAGTRLRRTLLELRRLELKILQPALSIVNRSGSKYIDIGNGRPVELFSLVDLAYEEHPDSDCPLCKLGSRPYWPRRQWKIFSDAMSGVYAK